MYKIMLVDDEPDIREGLMEVIPFESLGFTVVGEAENGLQALQLCQTVKPDVLITDIRMPLMDGLTLCRQLQKTLPLLHVVFLSGYDEFEYARQAIELNSMRYILKPISSVEFIAIFKKLRKTLDEEFDNRRNIDMLKLNYQKSLPLLRENLLVSLVTGAISPQDAFQAAEQYGIPLQSNAYALAFIRINTDYQDENTIREPELTEVAVQNIMREVLEANGQSYSFHYRSDTLGVLFLMPNLDSAAFSGILTKLESVQKRAQHYLSVKLHIGVSKPCRQLSQLVKCEQRAFNALEQSSLLSSEQVLCITDIEIQSGSNDTPIDRQQLLMLSRFIKLGNVEGCKQQIDTLFHALSEARPTPHLYRILMLDICATMIQSVQNIIPYADIACEDFDNMIGALMKCPPENQARELLHMFCVSLIRKIDSNRISSSQSIIHQALDIVSQEYGNEEMNIESICQRLHISTSYFSMLFKRETQKTFHQHLTDFRMDKAMEMLTNSASLTADVAQAVGIPDQSYFSYAFKKHFGLSPSQARKSRVDAV